jgi:hypothetical protein
MAAAATILNPDATDTDTIGPIVLVVAVAAVLIAGKVQERNRKEGPPS